MLQHLPLASLHPNAYDAAVAVECSGEQGSFWEMHDAVFEHQDSLSPAMQVLQARAINADGAQYDECVGSDRPRALIERHVAVAEALGIGSTPTIVVGETLDRSTLRVAAGFSGVGHDEALWQAVRTLLSRR